MTNNHFDQEKLSQIMERIMFDSVQQEVDMTDPKEKREFVAQIVEKVLGKGHVQQEEYEETIMQDMFREETLDKTGEKGYREIMKGAKANEYRNNLDATRK